MTQTLPRTELLAAPNFTLVDPPKFDPGQRNATAPYLNCI